MLVMINNKTAKVEETVIDGEAYLLVDAVAVTGGDVMNDIKYPDRVVDNYIDQLVDMPVVYRHPAVEGKHVSATNPKAINKNPVIGFVKAVRKEGADYIAQMAINLGIAAKFAAVSDIVQDLKSGIKRGVSTGLIPDVFNGAVKSIKWDHLAVLDSNERPAGKRTFTANSSNEQQVRFTQSMCEAMGLTWTEANCSQEGIKTNSNQRDDLFELLNGM